MVVLGAGSAGEVVAGRLAEAGRSVALVAAGLVGGECPYVACMPSKALLRSASVRALARRAHDLGASAHPLDVGPPAAAYAAAVARRDDIARHRDDTEAAKALVDAGVVLLRGRGRIVGPGEVEVHPDRGDQGEPGRDGAGGDGSERIGCGRLVIATGSRAQVPPIDGLDDVAWWTSDEALSSDELPDRLVVVGGGPVGCELAQVYARYGVEVTVVESSEVLLDGEEPEVSDAVLGLLEDAGVRVVTGAEVTGVSAGPGGTAIAVTVEGGDDVVADRLLVVTGRTPNVDDIGLEVLGVEPGRTGIEVDEHCQVVGAEGVWAAGDVDGIAPYTHTSTHQGRLVVDRILGRAGTDDRSAIPRCVYTEPAVAAVGLTVAQARAEGIDVAVARFDPADTARAVVEEVGRGTVVLVADRGRGVLVGASLVGPHADEWLGQLTLAVRAEVPLAVLADVVQAFPTFSEALTPPLRDLARPG